MILDLTLKLDEAIKDGLATQSAYDPSKEVKDRTAQVLRDYQIADTNRNKPFFEFNNMSMLQRMSTDQLSWNQFVEPVSNDPTQAWRSRAFRPIVRNKIITIAAHILSSMIWPKVYAQNEQDEEDRDSAEVMRELVEWAGDQSEYEKSLLYCVIAAMITPAAILSTEYAQYFRDFKEMKDDGTWTIKKDVLDEVFSGFKDTMVPCDELWIGNTYEIEMQKQPFVIWRRVIDYTSALAKYKDNQIFMEHVRPGVQFLYSDSQNLFYRQYDTSLTQNLVEEVIYWNRTADLKLIFVNGVLLTDPDQPNPRKDKLYPFVKTGFELIDQGRFFYYKSLAFKLANDESVVNTLYRMIIDGTYIQTMPPAVVFGNEEIGSSVIIPGAVTTISNMDNPNASFQTISTNNNLTAALTTLDKVESSITESSADTIISGQAQQNKDQTAYEVSRIEANARTLLGLFGKMIGFLVKDYSTLRINDILQFMTVGEATDIISPDQVLKFRTFLLPEKTVDGKTKTKKISFDMNMPNEGTDDQFMGMSRDISSTENSMDDKQKIYKVNPELFRKIKFRCIVEPEAIVPRSDALKRALALEEYDRAMNNELTNKEAITRDLLLGNYPTTKDNPDKYMMNPDQMAQMQQGMQQPGQPQAGPTGQNVTRPASVGSESTGPLQALAQR